MSVEHVPVFLQTIMGHFKAGIADGAPAKTYFDGTFGRGGHTRAVLEAFPELRAYAMDGDEAAIAYGREAFAPDIAAGRLRLAHSSYRDFADVVKSEGWPAQIDLMLLDLGVSSPQLDQAGRGFSFYHEGPLDMRMDQRQELSAATIINEYDEQDLARIFIEYGEVPRPFRVVRAIVNDRKEKSFKTTRDLASLIERVDGWQKKGSHPATRYFLALRLQVNAELSTLEATLPTLIDHLPEKGLLAVVTFHSLEDRIVKTIFKNQGEKGNPVTKKVIKPSDEEVASNPRARSAKLRIFQKAALGADQKAAPGADQKAAPGVDQKAAHGSEEFDKTPSWKRGRKGMR